MIGIRELADHLNISIGTVSRALNNKPDVSAKTRELVLGAAADLGYVPNQAGRLLRQGTSNVIGFILATDSEGMMQGDLFFVRVFDGMQSVLSKHGLDLVALLAPSSEDPMAYLQRTIARQFYDALVLSGIKRQDPRITLLSKNSVPFVTLGRSLTDAGQPWLDLDFEGMVRQSIQRLARKGHRRIALALPNDDLNLGHIMLETYRDSLRKNNLTFCPDLAMPTLSGDTAGRDLAMRLVQRDDPATAVIFSDHILPFGLYHGLADLGLTPGKDLAIIGIGTRLSSLLRPSLTHYRFNLFELGQRIAEALLETMPRFQAGTVAKLIRETVAFTLVEGDSDAQDITPKSST
ncbi:MAG: substrate-binding domain-containing protein [Rhodobacteraceae bacterium]|nr:substrate-binding domain-containing protein [Paracoccaceae bacterium]PHR53865.1 MAG: LacI family transcriptional regulator [Robiginitomaculum sp.]